jgi:hypothetical protein
MSDVQVFTETLSIEHCCNCGITFGLERSFRNERRNDHENFCCPRGHWQHYTAKSDAETAQAEAERQRKMKEQYIQLAEERAAQRDHARRQAAAARGVVTRVKRRIGKGVCPCCTRTFQDLGRHMAGQHPDWSQSDG